MFHMRIYVHEMLFKQSFLLSGTPEQYAEWEDLIENWNVIGCYAMVSIYYLDYRYILVFIY